MAPSVAQPQAQTELHHLLLFDGSCGLCSSFVQFVLARDVAGIFHFASLASPQGRMAVASFGGDVQDASTMYVVADYRASRTRLLVRSRAALFVFGALGWPWRTVALFDALPTVLLDHVYDIVARNRHRLLGHRTQCLTPRAEFRQRFIDVREPFRHFAGG